MGEGRDSATLNRLSVEEKRLLAKKLLQRKQGEGTGSAVFAASFGQRRLWFLDRLEGPSGTYNMKFALQLDGPLDEAVLKRGLDEVIRRHGSLRTRFAMRDDLPVQVVESDFEARLPLNDLSAMAKRERETCLQELMVQEASEPFDLEQGPLVRMRLVRLGGQSHVLLLTMHHIVTDGWSMGVFVREAVALYDAYSRGQVSPLPELPIQYADYAEWRLRHFHGEREQTLCGFWRDKLAGIPALLELPLDYPRPPVQTYRGDKTFFEVTPGLTGALRELARRGGSTLFTTLLAAGSVLLARYSGQADVVVGTPNANRNNKDTEPLIGLFINTLVLRNDLTGAPNFNELIQRAKGTTRDAFAHQDMPFERLVQEVVKERHTDRSPIFQVLFELQNAARETFEVPGLKVQRLATETKTAKFDLTISFTDHQDHLSGYLEYNTDLFREETIRYMAGHLQNLLQGAVRNPALEVHKIPLLAAEERTRLLYGLNETACPIPDSRCFHELFEATVERFPGKPAVSFEDTRGGLDQRTYRELNARADSLAHALMEKGVGAETLVPILAERSALYFAAVLGIFKAGGVYVPLDPLYPPQRLVAILKRLRSSVLLASSALRETVEAARVQAPEIKTILFLEEQVTGDSLSSTPNRITPENLAYIIHTSGSTGVPKGAMVTHRGMINHLFAKQRDLDLSSSDVIVQNAPQSFDISVWQYLVASLKGGLVRVYNDEVTHDPAQLVDRVDAEAVTILEVVPSVLRMMLEEIARRSETPQLARLRYLLATGEALPPDVCEGWLAQYPQIPIVNAYGPTECSDDVTHHFIDSPPRAGSPVPIGKALINTQLFILDEHLEPVPRGVVGRLYVAGKGVGRGYLDRPERTASSFVPNPFTREMAGDRLYDSGDLARYLPAGDGLISFLGRVDHQVKVRGFRIELGEIEAALKQHDHVAEAVVLVREEKLGETRVDKRLVAYLRLKPGRVLDAQTARGFVREKLPDYMVPAAVMVLARFPLTANGKLDRKALPAPDFAEAVNKRYIAPQSEGEHKLAAIWQTVLGLEKVGVEENFFDLGGHSLLVVRAHKLIKEQFETDIAVVDLFKYPTIRQLAARLEASGGESAVFRKDRDRAAKKREALQNRRRRGTR